MLLEILLPAGMHQFSSRRKNDQFLYQACFQASEHRQEMVAPRDHNSRHLRIAEKISTTDPSAYPLWLPCSLSPPKGSNAPRLSTHVDLYLDRRSYPEPNLLVHLHFFVEGFQALPLAAVVVARSATKGASLPAGIATHIGFVPNSLSTENVGATNGLALVIEIPIISC